MDATWSEEGTLADMKHRLEKLRIDQSRQKIVDNEATKKDTLKILQSKFGSPVYDPTSPMQKAYDRRCARSGRRKSIEFEDLYLSKGSGRLHLPFPPGASAGAGSGSPHRLDSPASRKHPLVRSSSGMDHSYHLPGPGGTADHKQTRLRKSSDPSSHHRKAAAAAAAASAGSDHHHHHHQQQQHYHHRNGKNKNGGNDSHPVGGGQQVAAHHKGQGQQEGHRGGARGHKGIASVTVTEEDRKLIDEKLSGLGGPEDGGHQPQQRRRKISSHSKTGSKH